MPSAGLSTIVIAHRGASGYRPEHSRAAFQLALDQGADALEPDLVASRDGVLVIRHENEISGTTDVASHLEFAARRTTRAIDGESVTGWFTEDFTWSELSTLRVRERLPRIRRTNTEFDGAERLLRLEDLLELLDEPGCTAGLVAELKHATHFAAAGLPLDELFASAIRDAGWTDPAHGARLTVESFELTVLDRVRGRGIDATYIYLLDRKGVPVHAPDRSWASYLTEEGLTALAGRIDGISVNKRMLLDDASAGADLVARAHAAGLVVYCWTLRAENAFLAVTHRSRGKKRQLGNWEAEFGSILATGVDGVFADQPDLAIIARNRMAAERRGQSARMV